MAKELHTLAEIIKFAEADGYETIKRTTIESRVKKGKIYYYNTKKGKFYDYTDIKKAFGLLEDIEVPKNINEDDEIIQELQELLNEQPLTAIQKVEVTKNFWAGKQNEVKYMKEIESVIPMDVARSIIEVGVTNFKTKMYAIPQKVKSLYPYIKIDAIDNMHSMIDEAFSEFNRGE